MSIGKKIFFLLITLIILIAYSVSTFNYKTILEEEQLQSTSLNTENSMFSKYGNLILNKLGFDSADETINNKEPIDIELLKINDIILMNGTFKDENQVKNIANLLNINRQGEYKFDENRSSDIVLLKKLSLLIDSFKEFFVDGAKIILKDEIISLEGELKDSNVKPLLDSIILKSNLSIVTNIKESTNSTTGEIIDDIKRNKENSLIHTQNDTVNGIELGSKIKDGMKSKTKLRIIEETQERINILTLESKITFKRRSTNVTDESEKTIKEIANILLENSDTNIEIAGHTDSRGKKSLNRRISQDRANSVKTILTSLGVDSKRIKAIGYGEDFPIAKDDADGLSEINRRVEFTVGERK